MKWSSGGAATALAAIACGWAAPAQAQNFNIAPGALGDVAGKIGAQTGTMVTVPDPGLAQRRSPGVRGRMNLREALRRALRGTGAEARFFEGGVVRIVRARLQPPRPAPPAHSVSVFPATPEPEPVTEIIVTGSKQQATLDRYPGSVRIIELDPAWTNRKGADGTGAIVRSMPSLATTNLGRGREKIFIRGIADSSFTGPTQAATGQYLGDVRLTYNAPDPSLDLYDVERVEVLVGPQAPLYGAGSLGGIIRIVPRTPDLDRAAGSASAFVEATRSGGASYRGAAMLNLPIVEGQWGVRLVVSDSEQAGYIDYPVQGLDNINRSRAVGHRVALRGEDISGWTFDLGVVRQLVRSADGQYVLGEDVTLTRESALSQPFRSDYRLAYFRARKMIGRVELVSTTASVRHDLRSLFDASALLQALGRYEEINRISIFSHESRISGESRSAPWVGGASMIYSRSLVARALAFADGPSIAIDVVNSDLDAALWGQITRPIGATISATVGGRLTYARTESYVREPEPLNAAGSFHDTVRFSRTLGLDWRPGGKLSVYFRHDQGFRAGGLTAYPTLFGLLAQTYRPDKLDMMELGVRMGRSGDRLSFRAALFRSSWDNMQADLVDTAGLPYTANVGDGRIDGIDAELRWQAAREVTVTASAFLNDSRLVITDSGGTKEGGTLPNVAGVGGRLAVDWKRELSSRAMLSINASARHVGRSRLGVGPMLDIPQGGYGAIDLGASITFPRFTLSANVDNLTDAHANTFAFGNPFSVIRRDQVTPLRPRTVRLGIDVSF